MTKMLVSLSMSYKRKVAVEHIRLAARGAMKDHIGYLVLYPNSPDEHKWLAELLSPVKSVRDFTNIKGGVFEKRDMWKYLFDEPLGSERQLAILRNECIAHMNGKEPTGDLSRLELVYSRLCSLVLSDSAITVDVLRSLFA